MKTIELVINPQEINGVFAISLVDKPAIKSNFVFFSENIKVLFAETTDKKTVMGAILIPDFNMLRQNEQTKEIYQVFLSKETIKKASEQYLIAGRSNNVTSMHLNSVNGVHLIESWIKETEQDKSNAYGLSLPIGSWVGTFLVENDQVRNDILSGKYKGFSIEGLFSEKLQNPEEILFNELVSILNQ